MTKNVQDNSSLSKDYWTLSFAKPANLLNKEIYFAFQNYLKYDLAAWVDGKHL